MRSPATVSTEYGRDPTWSVKATRVLARASVPKERRRTTPNHVFVKRISGSSPSPPEKETFDVSQKDERPLVSRRGNKGPPITLVFLC